VYFYAEQENVDLHQENTSEQSAQFKFGFDDGNTDQSSGQYRFESIFKTTKNKNLSITMKYR